MTTVMDWMLLGLGVPFLGASLYLLTLTLLWRRPTDVRGRQASRRFCVLVPAYNEEAGIGGTVQSLQALNYPPDRSRIVVLADNCTDGTARIAAAHGADVIERHDPVRRGKGWALQFGID